MHTLLIKNITRLFQSESFLYYDETLSKIIISDRNEDNSLNKLYWTDLTDNKNNFLKHIIDWFEIDTVFDYCFPAILIHCIKNDFISDDVMLCLIEKLGPDFHSYNQCAYFKQLAEFSTEKREIVRQFLQLASVNNNEVKVIFSVVDCALDLIVRRDILISKIYQIFKIEHSLDYNDIADTDDRDGLVLCQKLFNLDWTDLIKDNGQILASLIDEYSLLSDKAFHYFMPACLILSLLNYFQDTNDICFYTLNNLCWVTSKNIDNKFIIMRFLLFTEQEKKLVIDFLKLILQFRVSPDESKMIQRSLNDFWLV